MLPARYGLAMSNADPLSPWGFLFNKTENQGGATDQTLDVDQEHLAKP